MKILILCTGNSCRSQMAQGFMQSFNRDLQVFSAGTQPSSRVNPNAIQVMKEVGIDITGQKPKHVDEFINEEWDYVITVCGGAKESCPAFIGKVKNRLHIGFDDPADAKGTEEEILKEFRRVRDEIKTQFYSFFIDNIY
jgi:arsenate reductase